jgi:cytochrome b561
MMAEGSTSPADAIGGAAPAYSVTSRTLHWMTAVLVLLILPVGVLMVNVASGPCQDALYNLHRSIGALLIPIVVGRLGYRIGHPPPPLPGDIPAAQQQAAHATHWALYALLIVQPFVGWIATSAYGAPITVFGLFELPPIWPQDRALSEQLFLVHQVTGAAIAAFATVHIAAALYHHFVRRDGVLIRMISG